MGSNNTNFIITNKWKKIRTCPLCNSRKKFYYFNDLIKCSKCRKIFSIRKGTIFENSKVSLRKWFKAIKYVTEKNIYNSVTLSKHIGVTQKTAYYMLKKMKKKGVIKPRISKQIQKQNEEAEIEYIRNVIFSSRISIPGTKKLQKRNIPKNQKELYSYLKDKVKLERNMSKKRKTPYEAALLRAIR